MKLILYLLTYAGFHLVVFLPCLHVLNAQNVYCAPQMFAEINTRFSVSCQINVSIHELFWYSGRDKNNLPLLQFREERFSGEAYGGGEYELSQNGSLIILNATLRQEGLYSLRVYYNEFEYEDSETTIIVYIPPDIKFPSIDACQMANGECQRMVTGSGELVCLISRSKPMIRLEWVVVNQTNVNFEKQGFTSESDEISKTSTSIVTIQYITKGCGSEAVLQCKAVDVKPIEILDRSSSTVIIRTDRCQEATTSIATVAPERRMTWIVPVFVVVVFVVLSIAIAIVLFLYRRKIKVEPDNYLPLFSQHGRSPVKDIERKTFIKCLKEHYRKHCFVKPLPWDEPIPIDILYTPLQCTIEECRPNKQPTGITQTYSSHEIFRRNNTRVLITGDLGYGKTTLTQHFLNDWIKEESDDFILIFVQLKEVTTSMTLAKTVQNLITQDGTITTRNIDNIIQNNECVMLLDGLDELSMTISHPDSSITLENGKEQNNDEYESMMIIGDLLQNNINVKYKNVKVWITSREVDDMNSLFSLPYSKVKLTGFSESDLDKYVEKTCNYTISLADKSTSVPTSRSLNNGSSDSAATLDVGEYQKRVKKSIEENDIYSDFAKTPLLLIMIVHIIAYRISNFNERLKEVNVSQLTTIVRMVITCLESRYVQKVNKEAQDETTREDIKSLELKLGRLVAEEGFGCMSSSLEQWNERLPKKELDLALSIGLLKLTKDIRPGNDGIKDLAFTSQTTVDFYHEYFQEFLTAKYITESDYDTDNLGVVVKRLDEDKSVKFLQFIFGLGNNKKMEKSCSALAKGDTKWNNLIDCLYEVNDNDKKTKILKKMSKTLFFLSAPVVTVKYLERQSHRLALASFCDLCHSENVPLSLIFTERISLSVLPELHLPPLERLEFTDMTLNFTEFKSILQCLGGRKKPKVLSFKNCSLSDGLPNIDNAVSRELGVRKTKSSEDVHVFEPINGVWTQQ